MRRLTPRETRQTLRRIGINQAREAAFAYADPRRQVRYHFHHHNRHQLLYAMSGSLFLETRSGAWLLPPQRAAWIPAGVRHATTVRNAETRSLYFSPRTFATIEPDIRILEMTPLLREMILYAQQWPADAKGTEPFRRQFFDVLMTLLQRQSRTLDRCRLPRPTSAGLERATNSFLADVAQGGVAAAARRAGVSERTFRRHFRREMGLTWKEYVHQARLLQAMEWLAGPRTVTEVALAVGFQSLSTFSQAFRALAGQNPLAYKHSQNR